MKFASRGLLVSSVLLFTGTLLNGEDKTSFDIPGHYTKYEYRIAMRDGVTLFTSVYVPKDTSKTYPFLMFRTPYSVGPYGEDRYPSQLGPSREFEEAGYIFVAQDVRGRWQSDGTWIAMRPHIDQPGPAQVDESTDTYDTVEWLLKHIKNNNGRVGLEGISFPGFYAVASMIDSHPAIKACSPQAPMTDLYMNDDSYHNGAFMLDAMFAFATFFHPQKGRELPGWTEPFDYGTTESYDFFLHAGSIRSLDDKYLKHAAPLFTDCYTHTTYDDFWKARDISSHLHNVHCAVLAVGGLFDGEDISGPTKVFDALGRLSTDTQRFLVEGPWVHGGWAGRKGAAIGNVTFASETAEFFRAHIEFPFFEQYLKDAGDAHLPKVYVFETGTNVWRKYESWPPRGIEKRALYLQGGGRLSFVKPPGTEGTPYDEFVSDPAHPVPAVGYTYIGQVPAEYMVSDQRFAAKRPDVLVYETAPLEEDLTVAGAIRPKLFVSTSGTDSDWVVKLIDVYPATYPAKAGVDEEETLDVPPPSVILGGYQQLVRGEPMRGKFRHGFDHPEAFTPGKEEAVEFSMPTVNHTFRRGHRVMVQVQCSWFPVVDLNPQTFTDIPNATPEMFQKATQRIYRNEASPSAIEIDALPSN